MNKSFLLILILLGSAAASSLLLVFFYTALNAARIRTRSRLRDIEVFGSGEAEDSWGNGQAIPLGQRILQSLGQISRIFSLGKARQNKQRLKLLRAGILMKPQELSGVMVVSCLVFMLFFLLLTRSLFGAVAGFLLGLLLPDLVIRIRTQRRAKKLNDQLPEALTVIANGIRAGFSFTQAVAMVVREMEDPIADELGKMLRENSLGKPLEEALQSLSDRTADDDLDIAITALLIQRQVGGSLADILDTIADTIRERVKLKGDIRTMTAQGKMSALIVSLMPFVMAFMLNLINPGYMSPLLTNPLGVIMLTVCAVMMGFGIFILTRIVKINV